MDTVKPVGFDTKKVPICPKGYRWCPVKKKCVPVDHEKGKGQRQGKGQGKGPIGQPKEIEETNKMDKKKQSLEEHIQQLEELIRAASKHIQHNDDIGGLLKKDVRDRMYGKNPECFVSLKRLGREPFFLPICNRKAIVDPAAINISMGVIQKLMANHDSGDVNELQHMFDKLTRMKNRYSAEIPKPPKAASRKAMVTKLMKNMGKYISVIKPKTDEYKD